MNRVVFEIEMQLVEREGLSIGVGYPMTKHWFHIFERSRHQGTTRRT